jgi:hypothetical protein
MLSPSFESKTSRDSGSELELIMDSKSGSGFMDCGSKTCRNAKFKSGFIDSESEISSPSFESETSRDSGSESELIMDS